MKPYRWLAEYYDRFFAFGAAWALAARERVLGRILPRVECACDLACGTGTTALLLAEKGIRMYGVDLSPTMCRNARRKAKERGLPVRVIRADMRDFRLPEPVDLILCEFDALNHVPRKEDLSAVARCVARALRPGGHFYCDVNNRLGFQVFWPGAWWTEKDGVALVMHGGYDEKRDIGWSDAEWFFREGKLWRRRRERVEEVCWSAQEFRATFRKAGFDRIRAFDAAPFFQSVPGMRRGCRTLYLARKSQGV
jgi:SAM-dependent methyltransferase